MARICAGSLGLLTVLFHIFLLGRRIADGTVLDPAVAAEWLLGSLLLLGLVRLARRSELFRGRAALVLWVLVLLLHAVTVVPGTGGSWDFRVDKQLLVSVPLGLAAGIAVVRSARRLRGWPRIERLPSPRETLAGFDHRIPFAVFSSSLGPRAPPA